MINASQAIVVTRVLGLDTAAIWSVCTRTLTLANQLVWRPFDFSAPMLSEMVARGENDRLRHRFTRLVTITTALAIIAAVLFALCNQPFVAFWTRGHIGWLVRNDVLLGIWIVVLALVHCHCGLVLITKRIGFMRYIYFVEGIAFIIVGANAAARFGISGLILTSVFCSLAFSFSYGIWRTACEFHLSIKELLVESLLSCVRPGVILGLIAVGLHWPMHHARPNVQLVVYALAAGGSGLFLFLRLGLSSDITTEFRERAPKRMFRVLKRFLPD
jgi:O-antigen/teichoic acid export membrane protein